jgi:plastocyanin
MSSRAALALVVAVLAAGTSDAAMVTGSVIIDGRPAADAIVYLERAGDGAPAPAARRVVMDQKNLEFVPKVLPVVRGTTIEFTNSDDIQHNVFSPSDVAGNFDLGTYGPGADRSIILEQPGEVLVLCNIHMEMEARILVLRDPYFAATGGDGAFTIADVPAGTYTAKIWRDGFLADTRSVDVPTTGDVALDLRPGK